MRVQPYKARDRLNHGLPPVLGVDHASNAFYMWLGALRCATHGTAGGRPFASTIRGCPLFHGGP
jgi:hypothetical protein